MDLIFGSVALALFVYMAYGMFKLGFVLEAGIACILCLASLSNFLPVRKRRRNANFHSQV